MGSTSPLSKNSVELMTVSTGGGEHLIQTDLPRRMGGQDLGPQPVELLLAALMGCTQATALFVGRHMIPRLMLEQINFNVSAVRDERGAIALPIVLDPPVPSRLQRIEGTVRVWAADKKRLSTEQMKLLQEQTERRCPVANMLLASGCEMDITWVDGNDPNHVDPDTAFDENYDIDGRPIW